MIVRVLVVDDEPDVEALFRQQFRREVRQGHYLLDFALSGEAALNKLDDISGQQIILLVSDINMPGMSGIQLLGTIRENYHHPSPVVMMVTAYGDDENYNQAMDNGADDFLTKPLDFTLLKEKLKNLPHHD